MDWINARRSSYRFRFKRKTPTRTCAPSLVTAFRSRRTARIINGISGMLGLRTRNFLALVSAAVYTVFCYPTTAAAQQPETVNGGVVEVESSGSAGISLKMTEDLTNLVDDGATRRVLPVVGKGALQMLVDLKYLRGVDMAILPVDVFEYAKEQRLYPGIESS